MPKKVRKARERVTIKIIVSICSYTTRYKEFQKNRKKIKKLKKINTASFQAKTGGESPGNYENKNYCSDQFLPDPL